MCFLSFADDVTVFVNDGGGGGGEGSALLSGRKEVLGEARRSVPVAQRQPV